MSYFLILNVIIASMLVLKSKYQEEERKKGWKEKGEREEEVKQILASVSWKLTAEQDAEAAPATSGQRDLW